MNRTQLILRRAAFCKAVAFDVFDTLIRRDAAKPTDLFLLMGKDFAAARVQAEREARAKKNAEVTLAEIYARPCLNGYDPADECLAELACTVPDRELMRAVRHLHSRGRRVYAISDMYLPHEQLEAMLQKCGYDFLDGVFVSSSYGTQKRSGKLFRAFLRETGLKSGEVLFVGDDWRADVLGAQAARLHALHLPPPKALPAAAEPQSTVDGAALAFAVNRLGSLKTPEQRLGFSVLGALCVAFCTWLHQKREQTPGARLFFLARDMYLVRDIYGALYPSEETFYLQVSRRSLCPAVLAQGKLTAAAAALPRQELTGAQIAAFCGTSCPSEKADTVYNLKNTAENERVKAFLAALPPAQNAEVALVYLRGQGLQAGDIIVDIGSGGTTQLLLETLLEIPLQGFLLACDARLHTRLPERAEAFLFDNEPAPCLYWAGQPMLERLLSQDTGATLGYTPDGSVRCAPQEPQPLIAELQAGARRFAAAWQCSFLNGRQITSAYAIGAFLHLLAKPTAAQARLLGKLSVEDGGTYPLAQPASVGCYLRSPAQVRRDFAAARWKIGFLKAAVPLPLPYDWLYLKLKK